MCLSFNLLSMYLLTYLLTYLFIHTFYIYPFYKNFFFLMKYLNFCLKFPLILLYYFVIRNNNKK